MKEVKFKMKSTVAGIYIEDILVPDDESDPKKYFIEKYLNNWNQTNDKDKREIIEMFGNTGIKYCTLEKVNMFTISRGYSSYDILICKNCKMYYQRFGLGIGFPKEIKCNPELNCNECNKSFKTIKLLLKHNEKNKHKIPDWLPDGV